MIKTILLDLDDTLLRNPYQTFAAEYLRLADRYFHDALGIQNIARVLMDTLRLLSTNRDDQRTHGDVIMDSIGARTGRTGDEIQTAFEHFYKSVYPELRRCTGVVAAAPKLVSSLLDQGYSVAIATNPIYPETAIRQRLDWAGLPNSANTYALITHSANMHFTKPDPAYYAEVLARVGTEPDEAIMVGDDLTNDIIPAAAVGVHTYHISNGNQPNQADFSGTLEDFYGLISERDWSGALAQQPLLPNMIEPQLRGNVGALFGLLAEVKWDFWAQHPDPNEWSILQIVCHLLESEREVQRPRLNRILTEDNPFLVAPKAPPGAEARPCDTDGYRAAREFASARQETIDMLSHVQPEDWRRPARHSIFGPTTLLEMAHFTAQHDRLHLTQLCQTLGRCEEK